MLSVRVLNQIPLEHGRIFKQKANHEWVPIKWPNDVETALNQKQCNSCHDRILPQASIIKVKHESWPLNKGNFHGDGNQKGNVEIRTEEDSNNAEDKDKGRIRNFRKQGQNKGAVGEENVEKYRPSRIDAEQIEGGLNDLFLQVEDDQAVEKESVEKQDGQEND